MVPRLGRRRRPVQSRHPRPRAGAVLGHQPLEAGPGASEPFESFFRPSHSHAPSYPPHRVLSLRDFRLPLQWCLTTPSASILPPSVCSPFLANLSLESPLLPPVTLIKCILLDGLVSGLQGGPRGITPCSSATFGGPYRAKHPTSAAGAGPATVCATCE